MQYIQYRDGHGLNDKIEIHHDNRDAERGGGASHRYTVALPGAEPLPEFPSSAGVVAVIQFQHGPRDEDGSRAGITDQTLLAILIDRYRCFQAGPFSCRENALVLTKLEEALHWMRARADERAARGVLGKNVK